MTRSAILLTVIASMMAIAPPATAQEEETVVTVKTATTVKAQGLRLAGRVTAPFSPQGETAIAEDCVRDRRVEVSIRRPHGYKMVGTDLTSAAGRWTVRVREVGAIYRIRIQPAEFAYSPAYGQLEVVRCRATTVTGTLGRRGFRIASVLGARFGRAAPGGPAGQLPATGAGVELYFVSAALLMAAGVTMVRSGPKPRRRR